VLIFPVMPAFSFPVAKERPKIAIRSLCLLTSIAALPAVGQGGLDSISSFRYLEPVRMSLVLPMDGPSASLLNPARLASAERGYADFGTWGGGDAHAGALSAGIGFARRFYLGLFASVSGGTFENTNATIVNNRFGGQFAYRQPLDAEGRGSFAIGIGEANRFVNSLGAFKSFGYTLDLGASWVPSAYPGGWRLEFGWSARDLLPFSQTVEDPFRRPLRSTHVDFAPWMTLAGLSAESPARQWTFFGEAAAGARYEPAFYDRPLPGWSTSAVRWYLPRVGARFRPAPFASLTLERLWSRYWAAGATLGTGTWLPVRCEADLRMADGPFLQYQMPDEAGWSMAWNLRILW
jgi:hypothetical protein